MVLIAERSPAEVRRLRLGALRKLCCVLVLWALFGCGVTSAADGVAPPSPPPLAPLEAPSRPTSVPPILPEYSAVPSKTTVRLALSVGAAAVLIPGVIGGIRTALGADDGQRSAGLLVASGGFVLAPFLSHMITREWRRAAVFAAFPAAMTIAATTLVTQVPDAIYGGNAGTRTSFGILFGLGLVGAVGGLLDTAMARERAAERTKPSSNAYFFAPNVGSTGALLSFGGTL